MKIKIYKGQYGFSTMCKNGDDKMYLQVQFKKGQEPEIEKGTIEIKEGFLSMYKNKQGESIPKLVIMEFILQDDFVADVNEEQIEPIVDDLPF